MSEKRFTIETFCDGDTEYKCLFDNKNKKEIISDDGFWFEERYSDVVELLNEQQATIELLTKRKDRWRELSNSFSAYCKCYEKAIERAFEEKPYPSEEDIYRIYAELEKELENE